MNNKILFFKKCCFSFLTRMFYLLIHGLSSTILTSITFTMRCTFLTPDVTLTVTFQAVSFFTFTSPNLSCIEFVYFMCLDTFTAYEIYCILPLIRVSLIIQTIIALTLGSTQSVVVKARTIQLQAMCFSAMTGHK